jgi:glycosyltransferase involved in cell wall biosynthesis
MKKVLLVPDIKGWVIEDMAFGIKKSLSHKFDFTIKYSDGLSGGDVIDWKTDYEKYDVVYLMTPSYIPEDLKDYSKVITTFHGGPGTEGQANMIEIYGLKDMRISYVSNQTRKRLVEADFTSSDRISIPKGHNLSSYAKKKLNIKKVDKMDVREDGDCYRVGYTKKGFGLTNLWFTPHGVDIDVFTQDKVHDKFTCGYAGWAGYLVGIQKNHRRGRWILDAFGSSNFNLRIAAGIKIAGNRAEGDVRMIKKRYDNSKALQDRLDIRLYDHKDMPSFYRGISCYLVPDRLAGGPVPVLEAGAMGIPVICTDAGLCGDIIEDGVNGKIISSYTQFLNTIKFMEHNPDERNRMGKNLKEYVRENRSWDAVSKYWEDFING